MSSSKFEEEKAKVQLLMERLGLSAEYPEDPNAAGETGADVVAVIDGRRIGVQVTDLDTGETAGEARRGEAMLARDATKQGTTYGTWGQNDPSKILGAITRIIARKATMSSARFNEFWLLVCCGVPKFGAVGATLVVTQLIEPSQLDAATGSILSASKYSRVFIYAILGTEEKALYDWRPGQPWSKSTVTLAPHETSPDFWQFKDDPELFKDPEGWCDREVARTLAEMRGQQAKNE